MVDIVADAKVGAQTVECVVTRCGCGNPRSHIPNPCPTPRAIEDLGVHAYYHSNPLKRLDWWLRKKLGFTSKPVGVLLK